MTEPAEDFSDLEALYTAALLAAPTRKRDASAAARKPNTPLFAFPDQWHRTRSLALIHEETGTLLGNFAEYLHNSVVGARRLVREDTLTAVTGSEYVTGTWWLETPTPPTERTRWHERKRCNVNVSLPRLGLFAPLCELEVCLYLGHISRIELAADTEFASDGGNTLVFLPGGTDIRTELAAECKHVIRTKVLDFFNTDEF